MPLSIESEIDLLYHLSTMSEHVLPKGIFYLLLWKRLNQSGNPPAFSFNEMIEHLRILYDESVFDNPELPASSDHDFEWEPLEIEPEQAEQQQQQEQLTPPLEKDPLEKMDTNPSSTKTRKRAVSPTPSSTPSTPSTDSGRRSSRQRNPHAKDEEEQGQQQSKMDKRKSIKEASRASTRSVPATDSIGTRLRGQK